jgi:hypothetical protein
LREWDKTKKLRSTARPVQDSTFTQQIQAFRCARDSYNNRECLRCHLGARSFEEGAVHTADPDLLPAVKANKLSCISSGWHDVVQGIATLDKEKFWKGGPSF